MNRENNFITLIFYLDHLYPMLMTQKKSPLI